MIEPLTPNTQAILLLTAPLIVGRGGAPPDLLTLSEYNRLARLLRDKQHQPADLLGPNSREVLELFPEKFGCERLQNLLRRGFLLSQAVEHWNARAIWVVSRADTCYPKRLKSRLKEDAPPILYGCGDIGLLETGGIAVVGSRHVDDELVSYTANVGRISAEMHRTIISGGARGIDQAAMAGALAANGKVVGVMADSLQRAVLSRDNREPIIAGRLTLVSPYDPSAGFNVGHAMQRNKYVYALADASLVVTSEYEKGGTWAGAIEQLTKFRFGPLFVRNGAHMTKGNAALLQRGGRPWPDPKNGVELEQLIAKAMDTASVTDRQTTLPFETVEPLKVDECQTEQVVNASMPVVVEPDHSTDRTPQKKLLEAVTAILAVEVTESRTEEEIALILDVTKSQAKAWVKKLVESHILERSGRAPTRYRLASAKSNDRLLVQD